MAQPIADEPQLLVFDHRSDAAASVMAAAVPYGESLGRPSFKEVRGRIMRLLRVRGGQDFEHVEGLRISGQEMLRSPD